MLHHDQKGGHNRRAALRPRLHVRCDATRPFVPRVGSGRVGVAASNRRLTRDTRVGSGGETELMLGQVRVDDGVPKKAIIERGLRWWYRYFRRRWGHLSPPFCRFW